MAPDIEWPWSATEVVVGPGLPGLVVGAGPPVVYLPGLSFTHRAPRGWTRWVEISSVRPLARALEVHWIGRRPGIEEGTTIADLAADTAAAIRAEFGRPMPVIGFSTGGFLALQLAVDHPDVVDRLVLVGAAHRLTDVGLASDGAWADALEAGDVAQAWRHLSDDVVDQEPARSLVAGALGLVGPLVTPAEVSDGIRTARAELGFDLLDDLGRITAPTLLVVGERDPNASVDLVGETRAWIPGAEMVVLPGVGHLGSLGDRRAVQAICGFLRV